MSSGTFDHGTRLWWIQLVGRSDRGQRIPCKPIDNNKLPRRKEHARDGFPRSTDSHSPMSALQAAPTH